MQILHSIAFYELSRDSCLCKFGCWMLRLCYIFFHFLRTSILAPKIIKQMRLQPKQIFDKVSRYSYLDFKNVQHSSKPPPTNPRASVIVNSSLDTSYVILPIIVSVAPSTALYFIFSQKILSIKTSLRFDWTEWPASSLLFLVSNLTTFLDGCFTSTR